MDLQAAKLDVLQKIMGVSKPSLLNKINELLDNEMVVGFTVEGDPLTRASYNERLKIAEAQIQSGEFTSQEEMEKESEKW